MERNFSVDDIVGTLWKLDTNSSNNTTSSSNPTGDPVHSSNLGLEIASAQDLGGPADEVFKRITRVDSDWAFQDYFKFHDSTKAEGSDTQERSMRRNESMWAFQEFLKNYVLSDSCKAEGKSHDSGKQEEDGDQECSFDLNTSPNNVPVDKLNCGTDLSLGAYAGVGKDVKHGCSPGDDVIERHDTKNCLSHVEGCNPTLSNLTRTADSIGVSDQLQGYNYPSGALCRPPGADLTKSSDIQDDLTSTVQHHILESSGGDDVQHTKKFREQQVSGALNPLFTGLQNVMPNVGHANAQEYEMMLKRQLDLACAAVALKRAQQKSASSNGPGSAPAVAKMEPQSVEATGHGDRLVSGPLGIPALPPKPKGVLLGSARANTSGSSADQSEDDEADVESGANDQNAAPDDIRRMRRMLSNRESARRSRRRKQAHLSDLEMQVAQMRVENSTLFKQLTEITQKLRSALVDNQVLKTDVEALRAKVKMTEDLLARSAAPTGIKNEAPMPLRLRSSGAEQQQQQHAGGKMGRTPSMQRVASLEHLQKKIRGGVSPLSWGANWDAEGHLLEDQGPPSGCNEDGRV